jgi:hypothetical protein
MTEDNGDPFAHGGYQPEEPPLTESERRFIERWRRLFPNYRFEQSDFARAKDKDDPAA